MASVFRDNGTSGNWTTTNSNTTFAGNNGMFGVLGSSPSMHINFSGSAFVAEGAEKASLGSTCTVWQFFMRTASGATLGNGNTIFTVYVDATFTNATAPIRIDVTPSAGSYKFSLVDPSNAFATTIGTTTFALGTATRLVLYQTSTAWYLYINNNTTPEITYTHTSGALGYSNVNVGTLFQNAAGSYAGVMDFGEFWFGNMNTAPSGAIATAAEVWEGYKQNHIAVAGQPYRNPADGSNGSYTSGFIDTVSEGVSYAEILAVQNNDQATMILVDNWALQNLLRSNSTVGNTQSNAAPGTYLNLMAFKYNSANTDGKGIATIYDANFATDSDIERAQALLWAHARYGSSGSTVGSAPELVTPNYLQRALNILGDLKNAFTSYSGSQYLWNDSFQTGATIQIGGDYDAPAAYKLFAQYDTANASFWNAAVAGAYDSHTKAANVIFTGAVPAQASTSLLNPDWFAFNTSTGAVSTTPSTYGDSDYGFNAFRLYARLYDAWKWYADSSALTLLQLTKTFFATEVGGHSNIPRATFKHDGTNTGSYNSNIFGYAAYWTQYANDIANATAAAMVTANFTGVFSQQPYGSFISESPNNASPTYGYFNQSLNLRDYMRMNSIYLNFGQATNSTGATLLMMGV